MGKIELPLKIRKFILRISRLILYLWSVIVVLWYMIITSDIPIAPTFDDLLTLNRYIFYLILILIENLIIERFTTDKASK